ncbi:MAG: hypothetical protein COB66_08240 [Coxiella sp. (in: Bacteria)]|nr:MAG: hypothetical protein COB66_08240 [Coxiella sp. (in: g-proteobacteria)]
MKKWIFCFCAFSLISSIACAKQFDLPVKTIVVNASDRARQLISIGTVESQRTTYIQTEIPGRVVVLNKQVGDVVTPGMVVAKINPKISEDTSDEAQAQVTKLETLVNAQTMVVKRVKQLVHAGAMTGATLEEQQTKLRVAQSDLKIAKAQASKASFALRHTQIKSTVSGRIQESKVTLGSIVGAGDPIYLIANISQLHAVLPFPQAVRNLIKVGDQVTLTTPTSTTPIKATVNFITPIINPVTRSFNVIVNFKNVKGQWHPGSSVTAHLQLSSQRKIFVVPEVSVVHRHQGTFVFLVKEGKPVAQAVTIGQYTTAGEVEVLSGLEAGDRLITYGAFFLHPGVGIQEARR